MYVRNMVFLYISKEHSYENPIKHRNCWHSAFTFFTVEARCALDSAGGASTRHETSLPCQLSFRNALLIRAVRMFMGRNIVQSRRIPQPGLFRHPGRAFTDWVGFPPRRAGHSSRPRCSRSGGILKGSVWGSNAVPLGGRRPSCVRLLRGLVQAWIELHKDELVADWQLAVEGQQPYKIEPLR